MNILGNNMWDGAQLNWDLQLSGINYDWKKTSVSWRNMNQLLEENFDKFELKLTKDKNISKSDATRK